MLKRLRKYIDRQKVIREVGSFDGSGLVVAVEEVNLICLDILIDAGVEVNATSERGIPATIRAIDRMSLPTLRMLVEAGADIDAKEPSGKTVLMRAIEAGNKHIFTYLMEKEPELELLGPGRETALFIAIRSGNTTLARKLLEAGAEYDIRNQQGITPLMVAVELEKIGIVKALLTAGADPNLTDRDGHSALDRSISNPRLMKLLRHASLASLRAESGQARPTRTDQWSVPLLWSKGLLKHFPQLSALVIGLADGVMQTLDAKDVLVEWELRGKELLDRMEKQEAEAGPQSGTIPLISDKISDWLGFFLGGITTNGTEQASGTDSSQSSMVQWDQALLEAISLDSEMLVKLCLEQGANPNATNLAGQTALSLAVDQAAILRVLIQAGAVSATEDEDSSEA